MANGLWEVRMLISPALAFQDVAFYKTMGGGTAMGSGTAMGGILPLIVILAVFLIALVFLGQKKGRKRKRRRSSRGNIR